MREAKPGSGAAADWEIEAEYRLRQGARTAWYLGHRSAAQFLSGLLGLEGWRGSTDLPRPDRSRLMADWRALFDRDLAHIAAGVYPMPRGTFDLADLLARSRLFLQDIPRSHARRAKGATSEVFTEATRGRRPRYYLQNFHYQSDGWMSERSARIYDTQVEVLFRGTADVMRRQALAALSELVRGRPQGDLRVLDLACGTGRFLAQAAEAFPRLGLVGADLSEAYAGEAATALADRPRANVLVAKGEQLPFAEASLDGVVSTFLFHELPPKVRRQVAGEIGRVLKPGGRLIFLETLQIGDVEAYDGLLDMFPQNFHEPYYASYIREDLDRLFRRGGLRQVAAEQVFVAKLSTYEKPL